MLRERIRSESRTRLPTRKTGTGLEQQRKWKPPEPGLSLRSLFRHHANSTESLARHRHQIQGLPGSGLPVVRST